jgi:hypothetical protein
MIVTNYKQAHLSDSSTIPAKLQEWMQPTLNTNKIYREYMVRRIHLASTHTAYV